MRLAAHARSLAEFLRLANRPAEALAADNLAAAIARLTVRRLP